MQWLVFVYKVWVPGYWEEAHLDFFGAGFNMNLLAMYGGFWKNVTSYNRFNGDVEKVVEDYKLGNHL